MRASQKKLDTKRERERERERNERRGRRRENGMKKRLDKFYYKQSKTIYSSH
jgi:hypothetical protein